MSFVCRYRDYCCLTYRIKHYYSQIQFEKWTISYTTYMVIHVLFCLFGSQALNCTVLDTYIVYYFSSLKCFEALAIYRCNFQLPKLIKQHTGSPRYISSWATPQNFTYWYHTVLSFYFQLSTLVQFIFCYDNSFSMVA